jgi:hypothetical protein
LKADIFAKAAPWLAAGVRVSVNTIVPIVLSTSADGYTTPGGQTVKAAVEPERLALNADMRANFRSYGFSRIHDIALLSKIKPIPASGERMVAFRGPTAQACTPTISPTTRL